MRISIREQLGLLVLVCSLMALMILSLATWFQNKSFITDIRVSGLSLTASLKAAEVSSTLLLYEAQVRSVSTRVLIQSALQRFYQGNNTAENWVRSQSDLESALSTGNLLVQATLFPRVDVNNVTANSGLINVTSPEILGRVRLPYTHPNGSDVYLGDAGFGYPPNLYPNLTYSTGSSPNVTEASYNGMRLVPRSVMFLGPMILNDSAALISATTAVLNNTLQQEILGWLTVVVNASLLLEMRDSLEGLGNTGAVLIVGPEAVENKFSPPIQGASEETIANMDVRFILPPSRNETIFKRHSDRSFPKNASIPFLIQDFPAVEDAWTVDNQAINNAGAMITTNNEQGIAISAGYARVSTPLVDWVLIVEQSRNEVVAPIDHLRDITLICVFSVVAGLMLIVFPLAHYSITPIRQLRTATAKTVEPYQPDDNASGFTSSHIGHDEDDTDADVDADAVMARKEGFMGFLSRFHGSSTKRERPTSSTRRRRTFRIPSKVPERRHIITDELTELTRTFNEMSDELTMQYQRLEERVKERTAELERSKLAAEAANQSKTLFIANISHELKTPLNGILGLTTVCMNEDDPSKIKSTLNTIYKSGDLLLHLLTDLLTFSKNEVGQQMSIEEAEFRLMDLSTQLMPTFEKQAREGQIDLKVLYFGTNGAFGDTENADKDYGPEGTGRVKDMCLWGDKNRILQVLMNFVSNSLKFTPPHGSVTVRIRCTGIVEHPEIKGGSERKSSMRSQHSKRSSQKKVRTSDTSLIIPDRKKTDSLQLGDANFSINVAGGTAQIPKIAERQRSMSPPPINTKDLQFEFEVEDTGPGIPEDQQKKIFEPFVQGDLGLSKKYGGTGLGLSICVQLAGLMGGTIFLDSKVGQGSRFTMKLPLRYVAQRTASVSSARRSLSKASSLVNGYEDSDQTLQSNSTDDEAIRSPIPRIIGFSQPYMAKEVKKAHTDNLDVLKRAEHEAKKDGRKVRVLVAEDNKVNQEVVLRMLKLEHIYDVTIAKDGQEAFELVRDSMQNGTRFHLVFMDVQMPNLDGIQSTKLIRSMGFSAPIVALTAFAEKSNEDECMASGMDYFLAKPIKRPALKHVLKKYCATIIEEDGEVSPGSQARAEEVEDVAKRQAHVNGVKKQEPKDHLTKTSVGAVNARTVSPVS